MSPESAAIILPMFYASYDPILSQDIADKTTYSMTLSQIGNTTPYYTERLQDLSTLYLQRVQNSVALTSLSLQLGLFFQCLKFSGLIAFAVRSTSNPSTIS